MKSYNPIYWLLDRYVKKSKRFKEAVYEKIEDDQGVVYRCPACKKISPEPWKICENCMYPLPIIGGSVHKT